MAAATPKLADLSPAQAQRAAALLDEALDLPAAARAAWHATLGQREPALADLVRALLVAASRPAHSPRAETGELIARRAAQAAGPAPSLEGRLFGPYRVLRLLGQGGMGTVWLAERADGMFERQVALKLVHASLFGSTLRERFARERRILAALAHPNIVPLLDAGVAADGQPYLALDYVQGTPLTAFCDTRALPLRARLALLLQVLGAVQHAHQNLVVHRDLKPANLLVTDEGQVRLLDFGIAKLMHDGAAEETELTQLGGRALTPQYASPEQAAGRPVGTASDVYSLGVVLYELLCGQRPAAVTADAPAPPPLRPGQQALSEAVARARGSTPRALAQALAGDLDTIVLKALKADPTDRYATADALAQDLQRHLAGQPVLARPDSAAYRLRKFVQRHRWRVATAAMGVLLLLAAATVALWQARAAQLQASHAQEASQRAQAVQAFLLDIFNANSLRQADPLKARQTPARALLDIGAQRAAEQLKDAPKAQEAVFDTLADMYFQLELFDEAARLREQRAQALARAYGPDDLRVVEAWLAYANDVSSGDQRERGLAALDKARAILDARGDHASEERGWLALETSRFEQYRSVPRSLAEADAALAHFGAHPGRWTNLYHALQAAARARYVAGDFAAALPLHAQALAHAERHEPATPAWRSTPWVQMAEAEAELLRLDEAEAHLRAALALNLQIHGELAAVTQQTQAKLGGLLHASGRRGEGWALLQQAQARLAQPGATSTPDAASAVRLFLGMAAVARGDIALGQAQLAAEVADLRVHYPGSPPLARALLLQAPTLAALGRHAEADAALEEAVALWQAVAAAGARPWMLNRYRLEQARVALARHDPGQALQRLQQLHLPAEAAQARPLDAAHASLLQATAALQQQRWPDALALASQTLQALESPPLRARFPALQADALLRHGQAQQGLGDRAAARRDIEAALVLRSAIDVPASPWLAEVRDALAAAQSAGTVPVSCVGSASKPCPGARKAGTPGASAAP